MLVFDSFFVLDYVVVLDYFVVFFSLTPFLDIFITVSLSTDCQTRNPVEGDDQITVLSQLKEGYLQW